MAFPVEALQKYSLRCIRKVCDVLHLLQQSPTRNTPLLLIQTFAFLQFIHVLLLCFCFIHETVQIHHHQRGRLGHVHLQGTIRHSEEMPGLRFLHGRSGRSILALQWHGFGILRLVAALCCRRICRCRRISCCWWILCCRRICCRWIRGFGLRLHALRHRYSISLQVLLRHFHGGTQRVIAVVCTIHFRPLALVSLHFLV
eukprot:Skav229324  [mRNA]  locus=scaffold2688:58976:66770:+ [translate_table: standard]